jgi:uncharacterized protein (UPF0333 family)
MSVKHPRRSPARRQPRGQSMLEYSLLNWVLVVALIIGASVKIRWTEDLQSNVIDLFMNALQHYYNSFYFMLNQPIP